MKTENEIKPQRYEISSERILISFAILLFAGILSFDTFCKNIKVIKIAPLTQNIKSETVLNKSGKINLNKASQEELTKLKGVGNAISKRIIEYRETHGGFSKIEEILNVRGIGNKFFEEIKDNICI